MTFASGVAPSEMMNVVMAQIEKHFIKLIKLIIKSSDQIKKEYQDKEHWEAYYHKITIRDFVEEMLLFVIFFVRVLLLNSEPSECVFFLDRAGLRRALLEACKDLVVFGSL